MSISSLISSRALYILYLALCSLQVSVTAIMQPIAGTTALKFPPATAVTLEIYLGEHYSDQGNHTALLHFAGYEDFFWPSGNIQLDHLSWTHIGPAHFWDAEGVDYAFLHAKRHLAEQLQHYPTSADNPIPNEMNKWRYPNDIVWSLYHYPSSLIHSDTMKRWEGKLPVFLTRIMTRGKGIRLVVCYTGNERKNVAEPAYLWIGDLLISFSNGYDPVPPTGLEGFDIDHMQAYVESYVKSHPSPKFRGSHQDVEKWKNKEEEWRQKYGEFMKHRQSSEGQPPRNYLDALRYWKYIDDFIYALEQYGAISGAELASWVKLHSKNMNKLVTWVWAASPKVLGPD
ncbi:hypothetical protein EV361DRAFT_999874 [Lentinula raphanica]|nr:hypothetical protein EV361DRAFT_999874 [Lentinula raphanica]